MQSLSRSDEQKLLDGVKQAVDLVDNEGQSPNDALQKVAESVRIPVVTGQEQVLDKRAAPDRKTTTVCPF